MVVCCDGLKGLPEAIEAVWPQATVQLVVVHLIRNSLRFVPRADYKAVCGDLKTVYTAPTAEAAEARLLELDNTWGARHPAAAAVWTNAWEQFIPFLAHPPELRKVALDDEGSHPTVLTYWRRRLGASDAPERIFDAVRQVVADTGVLASKSRRALDSILLDDAVATQDTVTQLVSMIRRVRKAIDAAATVEVAAHDYTKAGKPVCAGSVFFPIKVIQSGPHPQLVDPHDLRTSTNFLTDPAKAAP